VVVTLAPSATVAPLMDCLQPRGYRLILSRPHQPVCTRNAKAPIRVLKLHPLTW